MPRSQKHPTSDVVALLRELAQRATLAGDNPYRARAYAKAAETLSAIGRPLDTIIAEGGLRALPGIGETIAEIIVAFHRTGTHPVLDKLRQELPEPVVEMLGIAGLRPEKILKLYRELGIGSVEALEAAARDNRLAGVKGLGPALQRKILEGIEIRRKSPGARHLHRAEELLAATAGELQGSGLGLSRITPAGDFRRGGELVSSLAVVAQAPALTSGPQVLQESEVAVHLTDAKHFGASLLFATGSAGHLRQLHQRAEAMGLSLGPEGLGRGQRLVASRSEEDIYKALGLPFIPPELREGRDEIALAEAGQLEGLIGAGDIAGVLHAHTTSSDGVNTLEEMAEATRARGYTYFGVADHSQTARYAGGMSAGEIEAQQAEVDRLNAGHGGRFHIFKGIESDILPDGSLDYPDAVLASFDFVVASVHGQFRMSRGAQTERLIRAVENPFTTILGHMTGRQLLRRRGYDVDVERVLAACAEHGVAVEINGNPWRLDLDWRWHRRGLELGCTFSINPDAHSTAELDLMRWGVGLARKGGIPADRVLNTLSAQELAKRFRKRRHAPR